MTTKLKTELTVDPAVELSSRFFLDAKDRRYLDDQIRALSSYFVQGHLRGSIRSYFKLDLDSDPLEPGDVFVSAGTAPADEADPNVAVRLVTKATSAALAAAGAVLGIAIEACAPGGYFPGAIDGLLGPSVTGLAAGAPKPVRVSSSGRCEAVTSLGDGDSVVGFKDAAGNLTIARARSGGATLPVPDSDGQLLVSSGGVWVPFDPGSEGQILATVSGAPTWVSGTAGSPHIPNIHSPAGLWWLDGSSDSLNDRSGNGHTLTGSPSYTPILPGFFAARGGGVSCSDSALRITGDVTLAAVVQYNATSEFWLGWGASGETEATNAIYLLQLHPAGDAWDLTAGWEHGAGVNDMITITDALPYIHNLMVIGLTRIGNVLRVYLNGVKIGESGTMTTPTGGTSGALRFGSTNTGAATNEILVASEGVWGAGLSDAQMLEMYDGCLGLIYGRA